MATDEKLMTERERAEEKVRAIIKELDRSTLALLYKTLHDAWGFVSALPTSQSGSWVDDPMAHETSTSPARGPGGLGEVGYV
jgi:hypothetical protein